MAEYGIRVVATQLAGSPLQLGWLCHELERVAAARELLQERRHRLLSVLRAEGAAYALTVPSEISIWPRPVYGHDYCMRFTAARGRITIEPYPGLLSTELGRWIAHSMQLEYRLEEQSMALAQAIGDRLPKDVMFWNRGRKP